MSMFASARGALVGAVADVLARSAAWSGPPLEGDESADRISGIELRYRTMSARSDAEHRIQGAVERVRIRRPRGSMTR